MLGKRIIPLFILLCSVITVQAQATSVSPYSRYGYGDLQPSVFAASQAMGGIGQGVRNSYLINPSNPASYTSIDSLTFMMELGVSGKTSFFDTGIEQKSNFAGSFDYVAFQVPFTSFMACSFGLMPLSSVGYEYAFDDLLEVYNDDEVDVTQSFAGQGGFTQVYLGLSFEIAERLALGINARYMFGQITHSREVSFPNTPLYKSTTQSISLYANAWSTDLGLQYMFPIAGGRDELVLGATYAFKLPMGIRSQITTVTDVAVVLDESPYDFDSPQTVKAGFTYNYDKKLLFGADLSWQDFSNANFFSKTDSLQDRFFVAAGIQYTPAIETGQYYNKIRYRLGANYSNSYTEVNNFDYNEFAITMGFGFPMPNTKTILNLLLEYGQRGTLSTTQLREQYINIGLNISLNERWFVKRKFN